MASPKKGAFTVNIAKTAPPTKKTPVENQLDAQLKGLGIGGYERNARFLRGRKFEADFWFPDLKLVLEVDGGVWMATSGHTSGSGYTKDRERDVEALLQGIITVRYTSTQVRNGYAAQTFAQLHDRAKAGSILVAP